MGSLKIVHEKYADKNNLKEVRARHWKEFQQAVLQNPQIEANLVRVSAVNSAICTSRDNCLVLCSRGPTFWRLLPPQGDHARFDCCTSKERSSSFILLRTECTLEHPGMNIPAVLCKSLASSSRGRDSPAERGGAGRWRTT